MNSSQWEKIQLEHQASDLFARLYQQSCGKAVTFITHNEPRKPDVSVSIANQPIDIEIAHLYGSETEAKLILGKSLSEQTCAELQALDVNTSADERLINALNRILHNKAQKFYDSDTVWLVIRNAHPDWNADSVREHQRQIHIPSSHPFAQIWLIGDLQGHSGLVRLA